MKADGPVESYEEAEGSCRQASPPRSPSVGRDLRADYEIYRRGHPWVGDYHGLPPKAVVRNMFESGAPRWTFGGTSPVYSVPGPEGIVLGHRPDATRPLRSTLPDEAKTEELTDLIESGSASSSASRLPRWSDPRGGSSPKPDAEFSELRGATEKTLTRQTRGRYACWMRKRAVPPGSPRTRGH